MFDALSTSIPNTLSPVILWVLYVIVLLVWSLVSGILWYHWNAYDGGGKRVKRVKRTFFIGSAIILLLAVTFIFSL